MAGQNQTMLKLISFLLFLSYGSKVFTQVIDVSENTFKIAGLGEEVFYFGFAEGDEIFFDFEEINGKELKEIEITELDGAGSSKYMAYKTSKVENKPIRITATGIYKFRLSNSALTGRICKVKIQRSAASEELKDFNTTVYWKTIHDTIYTPKDERYIVRCDTIAQEIYDSNPQISSSNALNGNKNNQVVDFVLPNNTISWSFYIGTGTGGKKEYDRAKARFAQTATTLAMRIPGYGAMAALALTGASFFGQVQGEDNVKYWFLSDANSVASFNAGQEFYQYKKGDVLSEATQMKTPLKGKIYLALLNDNTMDPIVVTIRVTAIVVNQLWDTRTVQVMRVTSRKEAYLKN